MYKRQIQYLQDCATEAEIATEFLYIDDIGLGEKGQFTDLQDQVISNLFKLYPVSYTHLKRPRDTSS